MTSHTETLRGPLDFFGDLPMLKIRLDIRIPKRDQLPLFTGSAWRGLLGWKLKQLTCPFDRKPRCKTDCMVRDHCPYFLLYERQTPQPGFLESPRGYVICPWDLPDPPGHFLDITLFGQCARLVPVVFKALQDGQKTGLGMRRIPYEIRGWEEIRPDGPVALPPDEDGHFDLGGPYPLRKWLDAGVSGDNDSAAVRFATPVRLRRKGKYLDQMVGPFFFAALARRLEALNCIFHKGVPLGKTGFMALREGFGPVNGFETDLRWRDVARYSNRQKRKVPMGGLVGTIRLPSVTAPLMQWWKVAALVHVGKGASMGFGKIEIL